MADASGPGAITTDGCAVDVYLRLPAVGEPDLVHAAVPAGASILDLGCGVGRIADPLVALGHRVVAVDDSLDMLAQVRAAEPVHSRIEDLDRGERFDAVLMASHLANVPDRAVRAALFDAARRHLAPGGVLLCQWHAPEWFDRLRVGAGTPHTVGDVATALEVHAVVDGVVDATVEYRIGDLRWTQRFRARRLTVAELAEHGVVVDRFLTGDRSWFSARLV